MWGEEQQLAFKEIKSRLVKLPILLDLDFSFCWLNLVVSW